MRFGALACSSRATPWALTQMKNETKPSMSRRERTEASRGRVRRLLLRVGIACVFCSLLVARCTPRVIPPPYQLLYEVCIAEGTSELRIFAQVDGIFPRDPHASPNRTHHPTGMYQVIVALDGSVDVVRLPADDELSLGLLEVFGHKSELFAFSWGSGASGRTLYRITRDGFRILGDDECERMLAELQIKDASPTAVIDRLDALSIESGWKIKLVTHGGLYDLDHVSDAFMVRLSTEMDADPQELRVTHVVTEKTSLLYVDRNKIDGGRLQPTQ